MKHEDFREMISFYIDDVLSENEKMEFEAHLNECSDCRSELEEMKIIIGALGEFEALDLPEGFEMDLKAKLLLANSEMNAPVVAGMNAPIVAELKGTDGKKKNIGFKWKYLYSTAAALLIFVAGAAYYNSQFGLTKDMAMNSAPRTAMTAESGLPENATLTGVPFVGSAAKTIAPTAADGTGATADTSVGGENAMTTAMAPNPDMMLSKGFVENKTICISYVRVINESGKYQAWADGVIKEAGGNLVTSSVNGNEVTYEYEVPFGNLWITLDSITTVDTVKTKIYAPNIEITRKDELLDKSAEYTELEKKSSAGGDGNIEATNQLDALKVDLSTGKIIMTILK